MTILAIESSCDETSVAVLKNSTVLCNIISSQHFHSLYGGVVPELASRAHIQTISIIINEALQAAKLKITDITAIAVTSEPGLIGSLIVGSNFAKGLSIKYNIPLVNVNHIEGHLYSGCLQNQDVEFPFVALIVSGGHTGLFFVKSFTDYQILGLTKDDAAGEAFDKTAKLLGLPYPGGPQIEKLAATGNPKAYNFPRSMINSGDLNFSFSGLKTSVRYFLNNKFKDFIPEEKKPDLAASVQEAIVDVLASKSIEAAKTHKVKDIVIAGGVSANARLRSKIQEKSEQIKIRMTAPRLEYCMDNAAMIGFIAEKKLLEEGTQLFLHNLTFTVSSTALRANKK